MNRLRIAAQVMTLTLMLTATVAKCDEEKADKAPVISTRSPLPSATKTELTQQTCVVTKVVDGDTFKCRLEPSNTLITVRIIGIDTPETVAPGKPVQCYGPEASAHAKKLLSGKTVELIYDPSQDVYDRYGRTLAYVTLDDGQDFGRLMIRDGYAREYTYRKPYDNIGIYQNAERLADALNRGLWGKCS